jgi:hypothetical protein
MNKNRVPPAIFGPKEMEVKGEWRKQHNEERHDFYSSPNIIRDIKLDGNGILHTPKR